MASAPQQGGDRGNDTRRADKVEGMAFARGWRAGWRAALEHGPTAGES